MPKYLTDEGASVLATDLLTAMKEELENAGDGGGTSSIADGAVTTAKLANNAVTGAKIANSAITNGKLASNAVSETKIADGAVSAKKLASDVAVKNPNALTFTGAATGSYDGSQAVTINIPAGGSGSNVAIDTTLTKAGQAADAKAVGDKITQLTEEIAEKSGGGSVPDNAVLFEETDDEESDDTPSISTLTFTGAVNATFDGKKDIVVNIPQSTGSTSTSSSSDSESTGSVLFDTTLTEDTKEIVIDNLSAKSIGMIVFPYGSTQNTDVGTSVIECECENGNMLTISKTIPITKNTAAASWATIDCGINLANGVGFVFLGSNGSKSNTEFNDKFRPEGQRIYMAMTPFFGPYDRIKKITLKDSKDAYIGKNTKITVVGG